MEENHKLLRQWMTNGNFNDAKFESFFEDALKKEKSDLDKKHFTELSNMSLGEMKLMQVRLQINDMLPVKMPHNDTLMLIGTGPYRERWYLTLIKNALKGGKILNEEEARMTNRLIMRYK